MRIKGINTRNTLFFKILILTGLFLIIALPSIAQSPFKDVPKNSWSYEYVNDVVSKGIVSGYPNGTYKPSEYVTRAEVSKFISNTIKYMEKSKTQINVNYKDSYDDRVINVVAQSMSAIVQVKTENGLGTGFILEGNKILTAYHVVKDRKSIDVVLTNGMKYKGTVETFHANNDMALLSIDESTPLSHLSLESKVNLGQTVIAIGHGEGEVNTVTKGVVSNLSRNGLIQTDAAVNHGNSGCPILDLNGNVLGIVIAKIEGSDVDNIGYAVKTDLIKKFINQ
ncbi:trypsin-like peptidase domain-containing protein [Bacillus sp. AG4(2022)]|uniref:trypsin-like peptidase domain-containing protein n=1 Tax=Bacillus sp. AG4(2022) TaxID=2962594 RepID=UPI0028824F1C|nr:trypsin-like peptidase domain-containing protein [Bacillus sp. AG4(2022)]MDT0160249.1 trypsin-like peptidase domain-containing protein [Bacillus sp. AG4(2022)]